MSFCHHIKLIDVFDNYFSVLVLFGILPAAMAWNERYNNVRLSARQLTGTLLMVPGGRVVLGLIIGGASYVITSEFISSFSP